jgi:hypothetical protein
MISRDQMLEAISDLHEENTRLKAELETAKGSDAPTPEKAYAALCKVATAYLVSQHFSPMNVQVGRVQRPPEKFATSCWEYELVIRFTDPRRPQGQ